MNLDGVQPLGGEMPLVEALIALGANLPSGDLLPAQSVQSAMERLSALSQGEARQSRLFRTPAFPPGSGPEFVNAAIAITWGGSAQDLLAQMHRVERDFGRTRTTRWEARIMDLDLIAFGDKITPDLATQKAWAALPMPDAAEVTPDQLILPHPRLAERSFVLAPLADIAPTWVHPVSGQTVQQMLEARPASERQEIVAMDTPA